MTLADSENINYLCMNQWYVGMELILKSNNEEKIAKVLALAKKLNIIVERKDTVIGKNDRETLKHRILSFKDDGPSPFGDAAQWERKQRADRELPFSE